MNNHINAGRKPIHNEKMVAFNATITQAQKEYIVQNGGAAFLRQIIDDAIKRNIKQKHKPA